MELTGAAAAAKEAPALQGEGTKLPSSSAEDHAAHQRRQHPRTWYEFFGGVAVQLGHGAESSGAARGSSAHGKKWTPIAPTASRQLA